MKRKRKRPLLRAPAFFLLLLLLCLTGRRIALYMQSRSEYAGIRERAVRPVPEETGDEDEGTEDALPEDALRIDWEALGEIRPAAWLKIGDISFPVMHADENEYYLHRLPDGTANPGGSLFLQAENSPDFSDRHSIIYGHNMADGSMFGTLKQFEDEKWADMRFDLYLPDGSLHRYRLFSVVRTEGGSEAFRISFSGSGDFLRYQKMMLEQSLYGNHVKASAENRLLTLSTCSGPQGTRLRLLVQGAEEHVWRGESRPDREQETEKSSQDFSPADFHSRLRKRDDREERTPETDHAMEHK